MPSSITAVFPSSTPKPAAPVTPAIIWNDLVFASGQVPRTPEGTITGTTIEEQTAQVLANLEGVLEASGTSLGKVVKTTVYLTSIGQIAAMNDVYRTYFSGSLPARTTVEVSALADPGYLIEIEAIAVR